MPDSGTCTKLVHMNEVLKLVPASEAAKILGKSVWSVYRTVQPVAILSNGWKLYDRAEVEAIAAGISSPTIDGKPKSGEVAA